MPTNRRFDSLLPLLPVALALVLGPAFAAWILSSRGGGADLEERVPVQWDRGPARGSGGFANEGTLVPGTGQPSSTRLGSWPQFRGPDRTNIARPQRPLATEWGADGPPELWRISLGEGHAGAAIHGGRVYLEDYDRDREEDALRCLSLDTGEEIWRFTYSISIKRNHGMSRTVPATDGEHVVMLGPMCHVFCLKADTGELVWKKDLVEENGTIVPPWYAGQCPLIDGDRVILAPGAQPLMMALEIATGETVWSTAPDLDDMGMTHSSIIAMEFQGRKLYAYCTSQGVVGIDAEDGSLAWSKPDWKIGIANIPSPVWLGDDRVFLSGGYNAGCAMIRLVPDGDSIRVEELFRLKASEFGSDQQTPIFHDGRIYGVSAKPRAEMVCLDTDGAVVWTSGKERRFGLGPYMACGDALLTLNDQDGMLYLTTLDPNAWRELASAKVLDGHDAWGPMAYADGLLLVRDLTEMVCLDIGRPG